ncbi:VOC family protein [Sphingomonas sp.]|uniref:VOC family protein n=1 Tax=Sphingomonas sp. TaxID=28214 RepID=UPI002ED88E72
MSAKSIFINLPVRDLAKSTAFYEAIGCTKNEMFSGETASSMMWSENIVFMLLTHDFYSTFTSLPIADANAASGMLLALSQESREAVDAIVAKAAAAGGKADLRATQDLGFMYGRTFADPDGNVFEPVWMNPAGMGEG